MKETIEMKEMKDLRLSRVSLFDCRNKTRDWWRRRNSHSVGGVIVYEVNESVNLIDPIVEVVFRFFLAVLVGKH